MILRLDSSLKPNVKREAAQENLNIHKLSDISDRCYCYHVCYECLSCCNVVFLLFISRSIIMSVVSFCEMEGSQWSVWSVLNNLRPSSPSPGSTCHSRHRRHNQNSYGGRIFLLKSHFILEFRHGIVSGHYFMTLLRPLDRSLVACRTL